jgi:hypothetical protein
LLTLLTDSRHHHHDHHLENGNGVATARIEKYESADWRKEVVREKLSRLKTVCFDCEWILFRKSRCEVSIETR